MSPITEGPGTTPGRHVRVRPSWRDATYGPLRHIPLLRDWAAELAGLLHVPAPVLAYPAIPPAGAGARYSSGPVSDGPAARTLPTSADAPTSRAGGLHVTPADLSGPEPGCQGEPPGGPRPGTGDLSVTADGRIRCGGTPAGAREDPAYVTAGSPGPGGACILGEVI